MIDIEEIIKSVKFDIHHFDRIKDTDSRKMLKALEQQQKEIEELQAENKQLREGQEWISVDDRLPQDNTKVLSRYEGVYDCDVVMFWRDTSNPHFGHNPATHWKPLPKPPEDKS